MMEPTINKNFCTSLHYEQPLELLCMEPQCLHQFMLCDFCVYERHHGHKVVPLRLLQNIMQESQKKDARSEREEEEKAEEKDPVLTELENLESLFKRILKNI